jgi:hypothetical protein
MMQYTQFCPAILIIFGNKTLNNILVVEDQ